MVTVFSGAVHFHSKTDKKMIVYFFIDLFY